MKEEKILEDLFDQLWPLNRSLSGNDNRKTLEILSNYSKIEKLEIPSGTKCFDWQVPDEYNVSEAYIEDEAGNKICDFRDNNLHLVSYSVPVNEIMGFEKLSKHLHYIPEQPNAIPYKTTYYNKNWGFCISKTLFDSLDRDLRYRVVINASFNENGSMSIGERVIKGKSDKEILVSTYICHPSMANNELSGPLMTILLQKVIESIPTKKYTYRFVYVPETIGSIAYLSINGEYLKENVIGGFVVTCCGDSGIPTLKHSRHGNTLIDQVSSYILKRNFNTFKEYNFFPTGSDERQYSSPHFNIPMISLMRTMYAEYPEYHTSLDNKEIMDFSGMIYLLQSYKEIITILEHNETYISNYQKCEPFLQNKGLYNSVGGPKTVPLDTSAILWIMNYSDGRHSLFDIAKMSNIDFFKIKEVADKLADKNMITKYE